MIIVLRFKDIETVEIRFMPDCDFYMENKMISDYKPGNPFFTSADRVKILQKLKEDYMAEARFSARENA